MIFRTSAHCDAYSTPEEQARICEAPLQNRLTRPGASATASTWITNNLWNHYLGASISSKNGIYKNEVSAVEKRNHSNIQTHSSSTTTTHLTYHLKMPSYLITGTSRGLGVSLLLPEDIWGFTSYSLIVWVRSTALRWPKQHHHWFCPQQESHWWEGRAWIKRQIQYPYYRRRDWEACFCQGDYCFSRHLVTP